MGERLLHPLRRIKPAVIGLLLSGSYLLFCLLTLPDFGITWDEPDHFARGDLYLQSLRSARSWRVTAAEIPADLRYYGPFFDILSALSNHFLAEKWGIIPSDCARHLPLVVSAAITVLFTYLLAARAYSATSALLAALFLTSFPRFIGHSFNNPKDIPITMLTVVCYYLLYQRVSTGRKVYSGVLILIGGIAFATRIQYIIVIITILIYLIIYKILSISWNKDSGVSPGSYWDVFMAMILSIPAGMALWPYFWIDPLPKLASLFKFYYLHRQQIPLSILYAGSYYTPGVNLPWHYAPVIEVHRWDEKTKYTL